jgi:hypothetical protein
MSRLNAKALLVGNQMLNGQLTYNPTFSGMFVLKYYHRLFELRCLESEERKMTYAALVANATAKQTPNMKPNQFHSEKM